jgi:hypothetical protein
VVKKWQELWNRDRKGRHLFKIQENVMVGSSSAGEGNVITRLRLALMRLNSTLTFVGKHPTGKCDHCQEEIETVDQIISQWRQYWRERDYYYY